MESVIVTETGGLGPIEVSLADGGGTVTPASRLCVRAMGRNQGLVSGTGIDWGAGTGLLAIALARIPQVDRVVAIEHDSTAVANAVRNAIANRVHNKVFVVEADLYTPTDEGGRQLLEELDGETDFLVANPPASEGDDGLGWRRAVLIGAARFLRPGANALIQVSAQYGAERVRQLARETGFEYRGLLETTEWSTFSLDREDLWQALTDYVAEEHQGGLPYEFRDARSLGTITAADALKRYRTTGHPPLTRWQMHHFTHLG